jgi:hypothetical protein
MSVSVREIKRVVAAESTVTQAGSSAGGWVWVKEQGIYFRIDFLPEKVFFVSSGLELQMVWLSTCAPACYPLRCLYFLWCCWWDKEIMAQSVCRSVCVGFHLDACHSYHSAF